MQAIILVAGYGNRMKHSTNIIHSGWLQPESQNAAKDQFCFQFARTSDHWLNKWRGKLL